MKKAKEEILADVKGSIIVSCQALPGEPLYCEEMSLMPFMAEAAKQAGSRCIRTSSIRDVVEIKEKTGLPVIGLIKVFYDNYDPFITPTMKEIDELVAVDSDIIALDCTFTKRPDSLNDFLKAIKEKYPDVVLMADISTYEEAINAYECGVDLVGTTMSGYTPQSQSFPKPNFELVERLAKELPIPVIAEGHVHTPAQAKKMLELGAHAVVIGGAITRPLEIAQRFYNGIK